MFGKVGRFAKGMVDYAPFIDTIDNNERPFRKFTSADAYQRERAAGLPSFNDPHPVMAAAVPQSQAGERTSRLSAPSKEFDRKNLSSLQGENSYPAEIEQMPPNSTGLRPYALANQQTSGKQIEGGGFLDSVGDALTGKRYGKADMNIFERLYSGPQGVAAARQQAYQHQELQKQRMAAAKEAEYYGLSGLAAESYINDKTKFFDEYNENLGFNEVTAGNTFGSGLTGYKTAPKLVNNGGEFYTQGSSGVTQTADFGPTQAEQIDIAELAAQVQNDNASLPIQQQQADASTLAAQSSWRRANTPQNGLSFGVDPATGVIQFNQGGTMPMGGANGLPMDLRTAARVGATNDQDTINNSREQAQNIDAAISLLDEADLILEGGFESGPRAGTAALYGKADEYLGGGLPGNTRQSLSQYERLQAISKDLGIEKLQQVGGNDTERELLTAIQTTVGPEKLPETNRAILDQKRAIFEIVSQRPQFQSDWVQRNGSLGNRDRETGESYEQAWRRAQLTAFQGVKEQFDSTINQAQSGAPNAPPIGTIKNGYRFRGGNPNDRNNWEGVN